MQFLFCTAIDSYSLRDARRNNERSIIAFVHFYHYLGIIDSPRNYYGGNDCHSPWNCSSTPETILCDDRADNRKPRQTRSERPALAREVRPIGEYFQVSAGNSARRRYYKIFLSNVSTARRYLSFDKYFRSRRVSHADLYVSFRAMLFASETDRRGEGDGEGAWGAGRDASSRPVVGRHSRVLSAKLTGFRCHDAAIGYRPHILSSLPKEHVRKRFASRFSLLASRAEIVSPVVIEIAATDNH